MPIITSIIALLATLLATIISSPTILVAVITLIGVATGFISRGFVFVAGIVMLVVLNDKLVLSFMSSHLLITFVGVLLLLNYTGLVGGKKR